jgi:hypothetical protein
MSDSTLGTAERAVPTINSTDEHRVEPIEQALGLCDRALDLMDELQRTNTLDPKPGFQEAVAGVQAVRTELTTLKR